MLLTISNEKSSIETSKLAKILKIENKEFKPSGTIDEKSFESLKDPIINSEIEAYIGYMDNLGLLPYLKFNIKPLGQELKKKIINFILNDKTAEEYLIENFDSNNIFYPINMEFWKSLIEPGTTPEFEVNNSLIADVDDIYYIEKKEEEDNNENNQKQEKKENQNENQQNKEEPKKEEKKEEHKIEEAKKEEQKKEEPKKKVAKIGKLKKNLEYGKDYVIICGDLYQKIFENFEFDYIIKLNKITKYLPNAKKEENKNDEGNTKEPEKTETKEKLEINKEKNYLCKKGDEKKGIKEYVVDFYPIKYMQLSMKTLVNYISKEKQKIEIKKKKKEWEEKSNEEKLKIIKENDRIKNIRKEREDQYIQKINQLHELVKEDALEKSLYDEKMKKLKEAYKDIFTEHKSEEPIKLKKSEFFELMKTNLNKIVFDQKSKIQKFSRFSTAKEFKNLLIYCNSNLKENFDLLYITFENDYIIPKDETTFVDNGIDNFVLVAVDIRNEKGESNLSILEKNENEIEIIQKEEKNEVDFNEEELKDTEILSKEELEKIKENLNQREKLRKQQEKIEREKYEKMEKEKLEKLKKEKEEEKKRKKKKRRKKRKKSVPPMVYQILEILVILILLIKYFLIYQSCNNCL